MDVDEILSDVSPTKLHLTLLALSLCNIADAVEVVAIGYLLSHIASGKSDMSINQSQKELLGASVVAGLLSGGLFIGYLSDIFGRKPCLQISLLITSVSGLCSSLSTSIYILIFLRLLGGLGIGGVLPVMYTLGAELFPSHRRDALLATIGLYWVVGSLYASLFAWVCFESPLSAYMTWRSYVVVCSLPCLLSLAFSYFLVESPTYLINKNQTDRAIKCLSYLSDRQLTAKCITGLHNAAPIDTEHAFILLFSPSNILPLLVLSFIWFAQHFSSFGMMTWISSLFIDIGMSNPYLDSVVFAMAIIPGNIFAVLYIKSLGRRRLLFWGTFLSGLCILGFAIAPSNRIAVVLSACLYNMFLVVGWNGLSCLSVDEYFDTEIKSFSMGTLSAVGRFGGIIAQVN
jgi:MFS family permease